MSRPPEDVNRDAYVDLIKRSITNYLYLGGETPQDAFRCVILNDVKDEVALLFGPEWDDEETKARLREQLRRVEATNPTQPV